MVDIPVNVAPYFLYGFPEDPITEMFARVDETVVDGIEFALLGDPDLEPIEERAATSNLGVGLLLSGDGDPNTGPMLTDPESQKAAIDQLRRDIHHAARLGCEDIAVLTGTSRPGIDVDQQLSCIVTALQEVVDEAATQNISLHVEPVSPADSPEYLISDVDTAADIVDRVSHPNVDILYDVYHQQVTNGAVIDTFTNHVDRIGYVHVANAPDRGPPTAGELAIDRILDAIIDSGYRNPIGCEFIAPDDEMAAVEWVTRHVDAA